MVLPIDFFIKVTFGNDCIRIANYFFPEHQDRSLANYNKNLYSLMRSLTYKDKNGRERII